MRHHVNSLYAQRLQESGDAGDSKQEQPPLPDLSSINLHAVAANLAWQPIHASVSAAPAAVVSPQNQHQQQQQKQQTPKGGGSKERKSSANSQQTKPAETKAPPPPMAECVVSLSRLHPATFHVFRVQAGSSLGLSQPGPLSAVLTRAAPPATPLPPTVTKLRPQSAVLDWHVPNLNGAPLAGFRIEVALMSGESARSHSQRLLKLLVLQRSNRARSCSRLSTPTNRLLRTRCACSAWSSWFHSFCCSTGSGAAVAVGVSVSTAVPERGGQVQVERLDADHHAAWAACRAFAHRSHARFARGVLGRFQRYELHITSLIASLGWNREAVGARVDRLHA